MTKFTVIFVAAVAFHCAFAAPRVVSPPAPEPPQDVTAIVGKLFKEISAEIEKHTPQLPDSKQVAEHVSQTGKDLTHNLEEIVAKWKVEADKHKGEVTAVTDAIFGKVTLAIDNLKKLATPAEGSTAAEYKAKFDSSVKDLTLQGEHLTKDFKPYFDKAQEDISALGKYLYDSFWTATKTVQTHVEAYAKPASPQH